MKIAIRHILVTLAWVGLFIIGRWASANDWGASQPTSNGHAEAIPPQTMMSDADSSVVGEHQMPIGGVFGDTPPAACESCGGGGCMPAKWTFDSSLKLIASTRAADRVLSTSSIPGGPFLVSSGTATEYRYFNDAVRSQMMTVHSLNFDVSPAWNFKISRFLGRDGESRDHFIEFDYAGLDRFSANSAAQGLLVPVYSTTATYPTPNTPPTVTGFQGNLNSPFAFPTEAQPFDATNALAFNRATEQSAFYVSTLNEWELNYRIAAHNQPDQLVLNPNGRWYRQCQTGYYYSYLFGFRAMVLNEKFDYLSRGETQDENKVTTLINSGQYSVHSYNTMLGLQTGGTLEYRFCRWSLETHGKAGMFLNVASQDSLIQTQFNNVSNPPVNFGAHNTVVAFAGGFGIQGSYKFRPNLVGHISYDMTWVGDVARAPEQMIFAAKPVGAIDTQGAVFYNGVTMGLEFDW
ncbi:MAG: BBP7 family outer membrane beta-barrel protein [Planctomycetota bacterium]